MSDETENPGPEPLVIDPNNPAGAVAQSASLAPLSGTAKTIEDHMQTSPFTGADPKSDPFVAGFHEALAHLRLILAKL